MALQKSNSQVGPESGGFWPPATEIAGINARNFQRTSCSSCMFHIFSLYVSLVSSGFYSSLI